MRFCVARGPPPQLSHSRTKAGAIPLVLFFPGNRQLERGEPPLYADFVRALRGRHVDLTIVDVAEHKFDVRAYSVEPFKGHTSPYGNRMIAEILDREISTRWPDFAEVRGED